MVSILQQAVVESGGAFSELRVLDVGAGNGMVGEVLMEAGVARIIGIDILEEAYQATLRDRPNIYDGYYVVDLERLDKGILEELGEWAFDCMVSVAALGFGDIPPKAFIQAFNLVNDSGWIAFNIKESFLDAQDSSGFSILIRSLIFNQVLDLYHLERYRHRISIDGRNLYYFAVVGRKLRSITRDDYHEV